MAEVEGTTTSLWWDMESCPLPSYVDPYIVVSMAFALLGNFNISTSMVNVGGATDSHPCSAYDFSSETHTELHQTLVNSGIELHQLPPGRTNYEMEKMLMADVLLWAVDTPPPANIIFIVGNVDLSYLFEKLHKREYNIFLVCPSLSEMPRGMLNAANDCVEWSSFLRSLDNEDSPLDQELKQGRHVDFPLELSKQKNLVSSLREVNRNSSPEYKTIAAETELKLKQKATADDFREFINEMLLAGEFSQGFLMNRLRPKFEEQTEKVLDVKHLGYKKLQRHDIFIASEAV